VSHESHTPREGSGSDRSGAIEVRSVGKTYGRFRAVDDVSFSVGAGEIVAFVGPNGAGKSTTLKMISTYLRPTEGSVSVVGLDTVRDSLAVRRELGYLPENNILYEGMRVDRFLRFVGEARGLRDGRLAERFDWAVDRFELSSVLKKRIHQCSKGFHRRVAMAMALIHDPRVILLDEPTHGLDPMQVLALRDLIRELSPGRAIIFSSHVFQEVLAIADRLLVIHRGRLLASGSLDEVAAEAAAPRTARCTLAVPASDAASALSELAEGRLDRVASLGEAACRVHFTDVSSGLDARLQQIAAKRAWGPVVLDLQPVDLEQLFALLVARSEERGAA
jgi:ABC-2 type transport system ATP-binding protein